MNVWILSVRELARLLRGRLTWLAAALTVLSPLAGLTVYRSASADTMQSLYVANPAWPGACWAGCSLPCLPSATAPVPPAAGWRRSATRRCPL